MTLPGALCMLLLSFTLFCVAGLIPLQSHGKGGKLICTKLFAFDVFLFFFLLDGGSLGIAIVTFFRTVFIF